MKAADALSQNLQDALNNGVLKRLPLTFLPFVNEQLQKWQYLFPNERRSIQALLLYVASLSPRQSSALFQNVVQLEEKMDVRHWQLSTTEQTIQNSSQLARSPWFLEWRQAVQAVFDTVDQQSPQSKSSSAKRLVLLGIPRPLPLNPATAWRRWQGIGRPLNLTLDKDSLDPFEFLLAGVPSSSHNQPSSADTWVIDAGSSAVNAVLKRTPQFLSAPTSILLSYERLSSYRENFSHEMNTMRKDLADADAVFDRLRTVDVTPWSPPEISADPAVCEFVRSLYLTGNGAVIFANSFVEWGASEAFRRARPSFLAAKFGLRAKPKPFTGVAVFTTIQTRSTPRPRSMTCPAAPPTPKFSPSIYGSPRSASTSISTPPSASASPKASPRPTSSPRRNSPPRSTPIPSHCRNSALPWPTGSRDFLASRLCSEMAPIYPQEVPGFPTENAKQFKSAFPCSFYR